MGKMSRLIGKGVREEVNQSVDNSPVIYLSRWGCQWIKFVFNHVVVGGPASQLATHILKQMDVDDYDPHSYVDTEVYTTTKVTLRGNYVVPGGVENYASNGPAQTVMDDAGPEEGYVSIAPMLKMPEIPGSEPEVESVTKCQKRIKKRCRSKFSISVARLAYNKFGQRPLSDANMLVTRKWIQKYLEEKFPDLRVCDKNLAIDRALFLSFVPTKDFHRYRIMLDSAPAKDRMDGSSIFGRIFRIGGSSIR